MSKIRPVRQRTDAPRQDEGPNVHPNPLRPARHGLPGPPDIYPGKDAVAGYLKAYAAAFNLPVRLNARVARLGQTAEGFEIRTQDEVLRAQTGDLPSPDIQAGREAQDAGGRAYGPNNVRRRRLAVSGGEGDT